MSWSGGMCGGKEGTHGNRAAQTGHHCLGCSSPMRETSLDLMSETRMSLESKGRKQKTKLVNSKRKYLQSPDQVDYTSALLSNDFVTKQTRT